MRSVAKWAAVAPEMRVRPGTRAGERGRNERIEAHGQHSDLRERTERPGGERKENPALPETDRRSRGRALSDERSEKLARQAERQTDSCSPRLAARPVHD